MLLLAQERAPADEVVGLHARLARTASSSAMARNSFLRCPSERPSRSRSLSPRSCTTSMSTSLATKVSTYLPRLRSSSHLRTSRAMIASFWHGTPLSIGPLNGAIHQRGFAGEMSLKGQTRRFRYVGDWSAYPSTADDLVQCSETTECAKAAIRSPGRRGAGVLATPPSAFSRS